MRTIRILIRIFRWFAMFYTLLQALQKSRWLVIGIGLWKIFKTSPMRKWPKAKIAFISPVDPLIWRRKGWRKINRLS